MASCSRAHVIKAALVLGFLLILLNLLASWFDSTPIGLPRMDTTQWPKRTRTSSERLVQSKHQKPNNHSTNGTHNKTNDHRNILPTISRNGQQSETTNLSTNLNLNESKSQPQFNESSLTDETSLTPKAMLLSTGSNLPSIAVSYNGINSTSVDSNNSNLERNNKSNSMFDVNISTTHQLNETNMHIDSDTGIIHGLVRKRGQHSCPPIPPNLDGPIEVDVSYESTTLVEQKFAPKLQPGGQYTPRECSARDRVAIIVPYRDREQHLPVFLKNIHPFLMKQQLEYGIYIVEQSTGSSFNRASLMNIGFVEAMKQKNWDCMVFHDVDLLPLDDRNLYTCPDQPRHMSVAVDTFGFKLPYSTIFGGVSAMTVKQFRTVNGFSNLFWGWGGEDDDMSNRLKHVGFHIARYPINIARYTMLSHKKEKANPKRYEKLSTGAKRYDSDGLNSLHYRLVNLIRKPLFTWVHVELSPDSS
ncbi:beta-1,4-N-acetylgalactosaminyltransferase bre-4 [Malaya genurostris]|uniref:beta-1,4-N-acetylgalactosaminyltransferase bre-4 n=1 Tax=Malaya genurostris TaxID=325434 RepID=UPI0026F3A6E0|nr:beta-1,4-N-acetylgalactosaminyltransferase bre-4 [Malaya genurostris]XP_058459070.1 beta-1,4-N-acetylgalactosaminyltransferase bre-4 [Malaya genurostris]